MVRSGRFRKKGQFGTDLLVWILALFVLGIVLIVGNMINNDLTTELVADDDISNTSKTMLQEQEAAYSNWGDNVFIMVLILFWAFLIITSFYIDTNPIFFFISVVLMVGVLLVGGLISNTYEDITEDDLLSTFANDFPKINWVMENLLLVLIVIGLSTALSLYAKGRV